MVHEDEALAIDDAYCTMRETTIKSYQYKYEVVVGTSNTESEVNILEYLNDHGPSTAVEIAKGVGVHRTTVIRKIKLLEQDGVVVKEGTKYIVLSQLPQF